MKVFKHCKYIRNVTKPCLSYVCSPIYENSDEDTKSTTHSSHSSVDPATLHSVHHSTFGTTHPAGRLNSVVNIYEVLLSSIENKSLIQDGFVYS